MLDPAGPTAGFGGGLVGLVLVPAAEVASELLVCVTEPSSPGLMMRTAMFWFCGCDWVELADESADCWLAAD
jgi:hypothetical protein